MIREQLQYFVSIKVRTDGFQCSYPTRKDVAAEKILFRGKMVLKDVKVKKGRVALRRGNYLVMENDAAPAVWGRNSQYSAKSSTVLSCNLSSTIKTSN